MIVERHKKTEKIERDTQELNMIKSQFIGKKKRQRRLRKLTMIS